MSANFPIWWLEILPNAWDDCIQSICNYEEGLVFVRDEHRKSDKKIKAKNDADIENKDSN